MNKVGISNQKAQLCKLIRATGFCYIDGTTGATPSEKRDSSALRHQFDCLLTLFESGHIDPVLALANADLDPHPDDASLLAMSSSDS